MRARRTSWRLLRGLRANPPGMASEVRARRDTFKAALEQAEELLYAAETVGTAARPLLLFYGLSQAGRAVAAQYIGPEKGTDWKLRGHGVTLPGTELEAALKAKRLADVVVQDHGRMLSFQRVAYAFRSPSLPAGARMADLWATVPEAESLISEGSIPEVIYPALRGQVSGWPRTGQPFQVSLKHRLLFALVRDEQEAVRELLRMYPTLEGWSFGAVVEGQFIVPGFPESVDIVFSGGHGSSDDVLTRYRGNHYALPVMSGNTLPLHPFLCWWAILYALSMLARYEPEGWMRLSDIDSSLEANLIEHLLEVALDAIPEMLVEKLNWL